MDNKQTSELWAKYLTMTESEKVLTLCQLWGVFSASPEKDIFEKYLSESIDTIKEMYPINKN